MAVKFLDNTGLGYFWSKIKAWCNATFAAITHNHASSAVNAMTGYSKPNSTSAITTSDTLNQAVGKLEKAIDDADITNTVHVSGNEFIGGIKEFGNSYYDSTTEGETDWESSSLIIRYQNYIKGSGNPTANKYANLLFLDKTGTNVNWSGRLGAVENDVYPTGDHRTRLVCYKNEIVDGVDVHDTAIITVGYDENGVKFATCPSTSENRNSGYDILTRDWIPKDTRIVHTTVLETLTGGKIFNDCRIAYQKSALTKGTAPSSTVYYNIPFGDSEGVEAINRFGCFETTVFTDNHTETNFAAYKNEYGSTTNARIGVVYPTTGDPYGYCTCKLSITNNIFEAKASYFTKGTAPSTDAYYSGFRTVDSNSDSFATWYNVYYTDKSTFTGFLAFDYTSANSTANATLGLGFNSSGNVYTRCPNPSADSNTNNIATTSWVRNTINKSPTEIRRKYTAFTRGTAPSSNMYYWFINGLDNEERLVGGVYGSYTTNRVNNIHLMVYKGTDTSSDHVSIGAGYDDSGNWYTYAPTPATSSNDTNIATTAFVKNQDYVTRTTAQTITGTKTFTSATVFDGIIRRSNNTGSLTIVGASATGASDGGKLVLRGSSDSSGTAGEAVLQGGASSNYRQVIVQPTTIRFNTTYCTWANNGQVGLIRDNKPDGNVVIFAGSQNFDGAGLTLNGRTYSTSDKGKFFLRASSMSSSSSSGSQRTLTGTPDGSIYWNGQAIQTSSDERLKTAFDNVDEDILDTWETVEWIQFKYKDAVEEKGDKARYHVGLVAQRVNNKFINSGSDIRNYGIVCHEYQEDYYHDNLVIDAAAYTDEEGVFHEEINHIEKELILGRDEWTIRYEEALCMEAAYQRRKNKILENRISELEKQVSDMLILLQNLTNGNG